MASRRLNSALQLGGQPICLLALLLVAAHDSHQQQQQQQQPEASKPPRGYCAPISRAIPSKSPCFEHLLQRRAWPDSARDDHAHSKSHQTARDELEEELVYVRLETSGSSLADLSTRAINERLLLGVFEQLFPRNQSSFGQQQQQQQDVRAQILASDGGGVTSRCRWSVERLVCRLVYPSCHFRRADVSALVRPLCREDCLLLRDLFCSNLNWAQFVRQLGRAFNETLVAAIKWPLQLEPAATSADLAGSKKSRTNLGTDQHQLDGRDVSSSSSFSLSLHGSEKPIEGGPQVVKVPPIHFYWPHEHSLQSCERLPPLRPMILSPQSSRRPTKSSAQFATPGEELSRLAASRPLGTRRRRNLARAWPACSNAHLTVATSKSPSTEAPKNGTSSSCLASQDGLDYGGQQNRTSSGLECQPWTSQQPHRHTSSELLFDNMREAKNYCRNPGGLELKPWCYTQDPKVRWQYCNIEACA